MDEPSPASAGSETPSSRVQREAGSAIPRPRSRRGRERGGSTPGDQLVARLGPASAEEAEYHNRLDRSVAALEVSLEDVPDQLVSEETEIAQISFVSLDCETTGHFPHRMVELGALRFLIGPEGVPGPPRICLESLVHTTDQINPYARRVHGISRDMLAGAPSLRRVALAFHDLAQGAVLIEHSADAFDTRLVSRALGKPLPHQHLDTSRIAGFLFELRDTIGLERLCERLNVTHRKPHYALADAEATADCFIGLVRLGQERFGWRTLGDLLAIGSPPPPKSEREPGRRRPPTVAAPPAAGGAGPESPGTGARRRHRGGRRRRGGGSAATPAIPEGSPTGHPSSASPSEGPDRS